MVVFLHKMLLLKILEMKALKYASYRLKMNTISELHKKLKRLVII